MQSPNPKKERRAWQRHPYTREWQRQLCEELVGQGKLIVSQIEGGASDVDLGVEVGKFRTMEALVRMLAPEPLDEDEEDDE